MKKNVYQNIIPIVSLFIVFVIDFSFITTTHYNWNNSMQKYIFLQHHISGVKNDLSQGHLWLEEAISGDKSIDIQKDVFTRFEHHSFHKYLQDIDQKLQDKEDINYIKQLKKIDSELHTFLELAQKRWKNTQKYTIGSDLDQKFDAQFSYIISLVDKLSVQIETQLSHELNSRNVYFTYILATFLLINSTIFFMLFISKKRQKEYELSLFEEKEKAEVTLRFIGNAVITTDTDGNITFFNTTAQRLTELDNNQVQGQHIDTVLNLFNMRTGDKIVTPIHNVLHNNLTKLISNGTKLLSATGKEYIISDSAAPVKSRSGEILGTVLVFQNDTQRHKTEDSLKRSEAQYRSLVENIKDYYFFYSHDAQGVFTYANSSITDVLGYSKEEFMTHYEAYLTDDPLNKFVHQKTEMCLKGEKQAPYVISIYHKDGSVKYLEVTESPIKDDYDKVFSVEGVARDITQNYLAQRHIQEQKELLSHKAHHDALTNLPNRALLMDRLNNSIEHAKRQGNKIAILFIDLDQFKTINDSFGHHVGDEVLKEAATRLQKEIRSSDTLARLGGDEFVVMLDNLSDGDILLNVIDKLLKTMREPILFEVQQLYVTLSMGIAMYPEDGEVGTTLLKNADAAMYKAKDDGRNTYSFYDEQMTKKSFERIRMESDLKNALKNEEFVVYYQPQVDAKENKIIGMEALVRWEHPKMGLVSPAKFIPLAEEIGLIVEIDQWVMKTAMKQLELWYKDALNPGILALNLSMKQLKKKHFLETLQAILEESDCRAEWIELEVTEGQIMKNPKKSIETLNKISNMGIELAIDDFGTGYSSLSYLKRLPIDKLKIDKSFVDNLPLDKEDISISKAIISLAQSLKLKVIAEGVETKEQKDFLVENGCRNIQGYLYSKPVPSDEFEKILRDGFTT